ncbi:hypothetical protein [Methanosarcina sp.]|uniref:hypothetical protein n=1 Tax=Methanosarcina sp. TaxID=2213 RepID=UPI00298CC7DD|nr:hypothetical protein [Methanosarcina sp.]
MVSFSAFRQPAKTFFIVSFKQNYIIPAHNGDQELNNFSILSIFSSTAYVISQEDIQVTVI